MHNIYIVKTNSYHIQFAGRECRLSEKQAAYIWKRALEYPGTEAMFKELDIKDNQDVAPGTAAEMQELSTILEQQKVHELFENLGMLDELVYDDERKGF